MACFSIKYLHQYRPLRVYEVPAICINTSKSTYTFTSVIIETVDLQDRRKCTVNSEIFVRILFSQIAIKDIVATLKIHN